MDLSKHARTSVKFSNLHQANGALPAIVAMVLSNQREPFFRHKQKLQQREAPFSCVAFRHRSGSIRSVQIFVHRINLNLGYLFDGQVDRSS
jgi:hypothetical protein